MIKKKFVVISILMGLSLVFFGCNKTEVKKNDKKATIISVNPKDIKLSNNAFSLKLMKGLLKQEQGKNIFVSPLSVSSILAETENGAVGPAKDELHSVLASESNDTNSEYKKLMDYYSSLKTTSISLANSMWIKNNFQVNKAFISTSKQYYYSEINNVDFLNSSTQNKINKWISDNTKEKITKLDMTLDEETRLLLINTVYFKGQWLNDFNKALTYKDNFYLTGGKQLSVDMMRNRANFPYYENNDFQVVSLPYKDNFSMYVFLPKQGKNLNDFVKELDASKIDGYINNLKTEEVNIALPKFKLQYEIRLNETLQAMGINKIFNSSGLSGIAKDISISTIVHKSYLSVDEAGTEAAAVTSELLSGTSAPSKVQKQFIVNRPFFMAIRDNSTGLVLFMGKIESPQ